jgi:MFS family permease
MRGGLITVLTTSTLCSPLIVFCPVLVKEGLHGDTTQFSLSVGAFGVGGLLGAVALLGIEAGIDRRKLSSGFAAAYGGLPAIAAVNPWISVLPVLLALAGFAMSISNTAANSLLQMTAPSRLRGRIISLYMLAMRGGLSIGSLLAGVSVDLLGVRYALLLNGILALAAHLFVGHRWVRTSLGAFVSPPQAPTAKP